MGPLGSFTTTLIPPTIQRNGNSVVLNFSLTIPEAMFLAFVKNMVQCSLEQKNGLVYLGTSEKMQSDFNGWVAKKFTSKEITSEELSLVTVVSSIWMKTKAFVENKLKIDQNLKLIENEQQWQKEADSTTEAFRLQGQSGKVFTARQASFLLAAVNNIRKPATLK